MTPMGMKRVPQSRGNGKSGAIDPRGPPEDSDYSCPATGQFHFMEPKPSPPAQRTLMKPRGPLVKS